MENKMTITNELITALIAAQRNIDNAHKDGKNDHFRSGYASLESVIDAVKEPLLKEGITFLQRSSENERGISIETIFYGHGGHLSAGSIFVPADRNNAQAFGSAMTYARRYSLSTACGIGAGIKVVEKAMIEDTSADDDGNASSPGFKMVCRNGNILEFAHDSAKYLTVLRNYLGDPEKADAVAVYLANKEEIQKASAEATTKSQKDAYTKLVELYEQRA